MNGYELAEHYLDSAGITDPATREAIKGEAEIACNLLGGIYSHSVRTALERYHAATPEDRESGAWATYTQRNAEMIEHERETRASGRRIDYAASLRRMQRGY